MKCATYIGASAVGAFAFYWQENMQRKGRAAPLQLATCAFSVGVAGLGFTVASHLFECAGAKLEDKRGARWITTAKKVALIAGLFILWQVSSVKKCLPPFFQPTRREALTLGLYAAALPTLPLLFFPNKTQGLQKAQGATQSLKNGMETNPAIDQIVEQELQKAQGALQSLKNGMETDPAIDQIVEKLIQLIAQKAQIKRAAQQITKQQPMGKSKRGTLAALKILCKQGEVLQEFIKLENLLRRCTGIRAILCKALRTYSQAMHQINIRLQPLLEDDRELAPLLHTKLCSLVRENRDTLAQCTIWRLYFPLSQLGLCEPRGSSSTAQQEAPGRGQTEEVQRALEKVQQAMEKNASIYSIVQEVIQMAQQEQTLQKVIEEVVHRKIKNMPIMSILSALKEICKHEKLLQKLAAMDEELQRDRNAGETVCSAINECWQAAWNTAAKGPKLPAAQAIEDISPLEKCSAVLMQRNIWSLYFLLKQLGICDKDIYQSRCQKESEEEFPVLGRPVLTIAPKVRPKPSFQVRGTPCADKKRVTFSEE